MRGRSLMAVALAVALVAPGVAMQAEPAEQSPFVAKHRARMMTPGQRKAQRRMERKSRSRRGAR